MIVYLRAENKVIEMEGWILDGSIDREKGDRHTVRDREIWGVMKGCGIDEKKSYK